VGPDGDRLPQRHSIGCVAERTDIGRLLQEMIIHAHPRIKRPRPSSCFPEPSGREPRLCFRLRQPALPGESFYLSHFGAKIMRVIRFQRVGAIAAILTFAAVVHNFACPLTADEAGKAGATPEELVGSWKQVIVILGKEVRPPKADGSEVKLLHVTPTHFTRIAHNPKTRQLYGVVGGRCTAADGKYVETIEYADEGSRKAAEGQKPMEFTYTIAKGQLQLKLADPKSEYTEIWSRVE
jgi:hypothetical protein